MSGLTITSVYPILRAELVIDNVDDIPRATVIDDNEDDHSISSWENVKRYSVIAAKFLYQKSRSFMCVSFVCAIIFLTRRIKIHSILKQEGSELHWKASAMRLTGEKSGDHFGAALSFSHDGKYVTVLSTSGKFMYLLSENGTTWNKVGTNLEEKCILPDTTHPSADHEFGYDLVTTSNGERMVVGYAFDNFGIATLATFDEEVQDWNIVYNFTGENSADGFGSVTGISNDGRKIVVAPVLNKYVSIFYEYGNNGSRWNKTIHYLEDNEILRSTKTRFMDLSGDGKRIAVGSLSGVKVIQEDEQGNWAQLGQRIYGDSFGNGFGECVDLSLDGNVLAVGAPGITFGYVDIFEY